MSYIALVNHDKERLMRELSKYDELYAMTNMYMITIYPFNPTKSKKSKRDTYIIRIYCYRNPSDLSEFLDKCEYICDMKYYRHAYKVYRIDRSMYNDLIELLFNSESEIDYTKM